MTNAHITTTALQQIGRMNVLAISGGRYVRLDENTVRLPVRYGYAVEVEYVPGVDLYTVRRTFTRGLKTTVKAQRDRVYAEDLGNTAYKASCFRDPM